MAEISLFDNPEGHSILLRFDPRFKLASLLILSLTIASSGLTGLVVIIPLVFLLIINARLPIIKTIKNMRLFFIFILFIFLTRIVVTPGEPVYVIGVLTVSKEGLYYGTLISLRLLLIAILSMLFIHTTLTSEIRGSVCWFLKPLPLVPAERIGTMLSLVVRFIPEILNQARTTMDAAKARGLGSRKNIITRLTLPVFPLIRRTFENADRLTTAMEARSYSEDRTNPVFTALRFDWMAMVLVLVLCSLTLVL